MSTTQYVNPARAIDSLKGEVHPENIEAIQRFVDHLAAEGLSDTHQGRPMNLKQQVEQEEQLSVLERLRELDKQGVLDKLEEL